MLVLVYGGVSWTGRFRAERSRRFVSMYRLRASAPARGSMASPCTSDPPIPATGRLGFLDPSVRHRIELRSRGHDADGLLSMLAISGLMLLALMAVALIDGTSVLVRPLLGRKRA